MIEFLFFCDVVEGTRIPTKPLLIILINNLIHIISFIGPLSFVFKRFVLVILFDRGFTAASLSFAFQRQLGDLIASHIVLAYNEKTTLILSLMLNIRSASVDIRVLVHRHFSRTLAAQISNRNKLADHFLVFLVEVFLLIERIIITLFLLHVALFLNLLSGGGNGQIEVFGCV